CPDHASAPGAPPPAVRPGAGPERRRGYGVLPAGEPRRGADRVGGWRDRRGARTRRARPGRLDPAPGVPRREWLRLVRARGGREGVAVGPGRERVRADRRGRGAVVRGDGGGSGRGGPGV